MKMYNIWVKQNVFMDFSTTAYNSSMYLILRHIRNHRISFHRIVSVESPDHTCILIKHNSGHWWSEFYCTFIKEIFLHILFISYDRFSTFFFNGWQHRSPLFCQDLLQFLSQCYTPSTKQDTSIMHGHKVAALSKHEWWTSSWRVATSTMGQWRETASQPLRPFPLVAFVNKYAALKQKTCSGYSWCFLEKNIILNA